MSDDDKRDGDAIIEDVHEQQREMALGVVGAVSKMAKATGNDPVLFAMQRAHDVLEPVPPAPGGYRPDPVRKYTPRAQLKPLGAPEPASEARLLRTGSFYRRLGLTRFTISSNTAAASSGANDPMSSVVLAGRLSAA